MYVHYDPKYKGPGFKAFVSIERFNSSGGLEVASAEGEAPAAARAVQLASYRALKKWGVGLGYSISPGGTLWVRCELLGVGVYQRCRLELRDGSVVSTARDCSLPEEHLAQLHDTAIEARHRRAGRGH